MIEEIRDALLEWKVLFFRDQHRLDRTSHVAFGRRFTHVRGTNLAGDRVDMWFRETLGYRRDGGAWRIVHQHSSVPLDMKTMKGQLDLKP